MSELSLDIAASSPSPRFVNATGEVLNAFISRRDEGVLWEGARELGVLAREQGIAADTAVSIFRDVWNLEGADALGPVDLWIAGELCRHRAIDALLSGYYGPRWSS